jgi:hypothetical protein
VIIRQHIVVLLYVQHHVGVQTSPLVLSAAAVAAAAVLPWRTLIHMLWFQRPTRRAVSSNSLRLRSLHKTQQAAAATAQ